MPNSPTPALFLALLLALGACTGGQTGDITELTACERPTGTIQPSEVPEGFSEPVSGIVMGHLHQDAVLGWASGRAQTGVDVLWSAQAQSDVQVLGDDSCPSQVRAVVELTITTQDGQLDEQVSGFAMLMADGSGYVRAEQPVADIGGMLEPFAELGVAPDDGALLVWRLDVQGGGMLVLAAAGDDEMSLATW